MCLHCENASSWYDRDEDYLYASCLTYDADGWHVECFDSINHTLSAPIDFSPHLGQKSIGADNV